MENNNQDEDFVDVREHGVYEDTDIQEHGDQFDGESRLSFPDNTNAVSVLQQVESMVRKAIDDERSRYFDINKGVLRVNTNKAGAVVFRSFRINADMGPVQIVKEKEDRGNVIVTVQIMDTNPAISIGADPGISYLGSNTVTLTGLLFTVPRIIRTRQPLWAVASPLATPYVTFDVIEEFA